MLVGSFMKWVSMAEQPYTSLRSPCTMSSVGWSGVKIAAIGLWSSENSFSGVMNHASPSGSPTDEFGFGGCQENASCPNVQSWPKVLRKTQILIFTKFAASVSLDIFVRGYYGILKYNYKHFIRVKGFY